MYLQSNTQAHSCNHFCSGKTTRVTHRECVFVGILRAIRMHHIVICILFRSTAFFQMISLAARFSETANEHEMHVSIFSTAFVWNIFRSKKWAWYIDKRILVMLSCRYSCPILMKPEFSRQSLEKYSGIKFHENASSESRVVPCGQIDGRAERYDEANSRF